MMNYFVTAFEPVMTKEYLVTQKEMTFTVSGNQNVTLQHRSDQ